MGNRKLGLGWNDRVKVCYTTVNVFWMQDKGIMDKSQFGEEKNK